MKKFTFRYGADRSMTVTVRAETEDDARMKARIALDRRYHTKDREAPVAWTLRLASKREA